MPNLFCKEHGREHAATAMEQEEIYRQLGEVVLIVSGTLISGPWRCDSCNAPLRRGRPATLLTAFPRWLPEDTCGYDFSHERQYFAMERAEVAVFGAASGVLEEQTGWPVP